MGTLVIKPVSKTIARDLIVQHHYSHKWLATFGIHNFGIFREGEEKQEQCLGVASYGYMKTPEAHVIESSVPAFPLPSPCQACAPCKPRLCHPPAAAAFLVKQASLPSFPCKSSLMPLAALQCLPKKKV